jgi:hypothetical protein
MRRWVLAAALMSGLMVGGCSEQPTSPAENPAQPAQVTPGLVTSTAVCTTADAICIQRLINALFPKGDLLQTANSYWANVQTKVSQKRYPDAQARATDLMNFGLKNFYANKLIGKTSQPTPDNLVALNDAVYAYSKLTIKPPTLPVGALDPDGAAVVLGPASPTTLVITGTKQAGVIVPAGAAGTTTLVSIDPLPDTPGPLLTSLDQFPLFYEFKTSPEITFGKTVTTGVCQRQDFDPDTFSRLRLAHNFRSDGGVPEFGDIEILPRVAAPFLDCNNVFQLGALEQQGLTAFASAGWRLLGRTIGPLSKAIFLPEEAYAAVLGTCCLGGTGTRFSPHGAVDPGSNPGRLGIVDEHGNAILDENGHPVTSKQVTGPGRVYVKAMSNDGVPIQKVPVTFGGTTVLTSDDGSGIASFVWNAPPGTTLTASVPNESSEVGTSCPSGNPEPAPNTKYRPLVCFTPNSVTFTAPAAVTSVTVQFTNPTVSNECEGDVCSQTFSQDGYVFRSFWYTGAEAQSINGHFHLLASAEVFLGYEQHHFQADFDRQGVRITRSDGGAFTLKSIDYRGGGSPFEIGTSPVTSIVSDETFVTVVSGYTRFPTVGVGTFTTLNFSGFEDKTAGYITMRGNADWDNIVLTQPAPVVLQAR